LESWSSSEPDFERLYDASPFGSKILITNFGTNVQDTCIHLVPCYDVEQRMISIDDLKKMWNIAQPSWPEVIDWAELLLERQLHEAITLVKIRSLAEKGLFVFKSLIRDQKYLYNERKMLLTLPPHPHVIRRPLYVVTRKCRFGGKYGVCGFILEYYELDTLHRRLLDAQRDEARLVTFSQCLRWSRQITEALRHINSIPFGFYPDLKPDNIVLQTGVEGSCEVVDAVLLDLEQRGGWFSWSPPEIVSVEYLETLVGQIDEEEVESEIYGQLRKYIPGWKRPSQEDRYRNVDGGFSQPWLALLRERQTGSRYNMLEKAQVFLLGKLLWCIFEGQPLVRCGVDHEVLRDNLSTSASSSILSFPNFSRTPPQMQRIIRACTLGAPEWDGRRRGIVLQGGRLEPAMRRDNVDGANGSAISTQGAAQEWWAKEIERARVVMGELLDARGGKDTAGGILERIGMRPTLQCVLVDLEEIERGIGDASGSRNK
jgi:hypothetical protein